METKKIKIENEYSLWDKESYIESKIYYFRFVNNQKELTIDLWNMKNKGAYLKRCLIKKIELIYFDRANPAALNFDITEFVIIKYGGSEFPLIPQYKTITGLDLVATGFQFENKVMIEPMFTINIDGWTNLLFWLEEHLGDETASANLYFYVDFIYYALNCTSNN